MGETADAFLAHFLQRYGLAGLAVFGAVVLLALRMGWISIRMPTLRRKDDHVLEQMMTIVKENTAAFVALRSTMEDNKGITIKVSDSLQRVQEVLANMSGYLHAEKVRKRGAISDT